MIPDYRYISHYLLEKMTEILFNIRLSSFYKKKDLCPLKVKIINLINRDDIDF